jgi:hypothetical protein
MIDAPMFGRHATAAGKYFKPEIARRFAARAFADMPRHNPNHEAPA